MEHKLLLFLATRKGFKVLESLFNSNPDMIGLVCTFEEVDVRDSYHNKIQEFCKNNKINFIWWKSIKGNFKENIINFGITSAIAIGWRYLIPLEINNYLKYNLIILHDSLLPKYRGFSPTPTAIICGEKKLGVTALFADYGIDTGEIILQKELKQDCSYLYINEIIDYQCEVYVNIVEELILRIKGNNLNSYKQDETNATYSIWRDIEDCRIDWNLSNKKIFDLIRAVSFPYHGAYCYYENKKIYVWKSELQEDLPFAIRSPGKIWRFDELGNPIIVCGTGMLKLTKVTDKEGNEIRFNYIRRRLR